MKNQLIDIRDFISAALRIAIYAPLYKAVAACEKRNIQLPFKVVNTALHGQRRARGDWHEIKTHYFGY